jgi:hypothetical protein
LETQDFPSFIREQATGLETDMEELNQYMKTELFSEHHSVYAKPQPTKSLTSQIKPHNHSHLFLGLVNMTLYKNKKT